MSLRALVEVVVHFESFRNIDLFFQGIYYARARLYTKKKALLTQKEAEKKDGTQQINTAQPNNGQQSETDVEEGTTIEFAQPYFSFMSHV